MPKKCWNYCNSTRQEASTDTGFDDLDEQPPQVVNKGEKLKPAAGSISKPDKPATVAVTSLDIEKTGDPSEWENLKGTKKSGSGTTVVTEVTPTRISFFLVKSTCALVVNQQETAAKMMSLSTFFPGPVPLTRPSRPIV